MKSEAASRIRELVPANEKVAIVSDETVRDLYGVSLTRELRREGVDCISVAIRPGDDSKNMESLGQILDSFAKEGLGRGGLIAALGGGVVGDIAGFAAACWMRGTRYVQIPTSLLAMVTTSAGGNTAIDIPAGKNLVGAFHQPSLTIVDPDLLATLPESEFSKGMAEVIKYGAIQSKVLFGNIEENPLDADSPSLVDVITDCIRIKAKIVSGDELDAGRRDILDFGHTFGHALEMKYGYYRYPNGMAVVEGMRLAALYGETAGITMPGTAERLESLFEKYGLYCKETADNLFHYIKQDKNVSGGTIKLVLLNGIGKAEVIETPLDEVESVLADL